jgi:L-serine dehydratase
MKSVSIFNEVIRPVMRGPSSSHTAASYHLGKLIRDLLEREPDKVIISFAKNGSYAQVYQQQGSDLGFASGIMGLSITSEDFSKALEIAVDAGIDIQFKVKEFNEPVHPNTIEITGNSKKCSRIEVIAKSVGGGAVQIDELNGWHVHITGNSYDVLIEINELIADTVYHLINHDKRNLGISEEIKGNKKLINQKRSQPLENNTLKKLVELEGVNRIWVTTPFFYPPVGEPLFTSGQDMVSYANKSNLSLGRASLAYESKLIGISESEALKEMYRRYLIMKSGVDIGLKLDNGMQLLTPTAGKIWEAEKEGKLAIGGLHTKAAVRALAVMHVNSSMGVVCASPTGGAAGTLPGVITTLVEEKKLNEEETALTMFAAAAIGLILAIKGTFAAEIAGCQVEIGAAGAMGAAAVIEAAGGSARQACDAASISFQNTMGSVCDLVQGIVEIPCHTRNAVAASSAFVCADLILGGYFNPVPLDETIEAVMSVGKMLPRELRCTVLGGLALAPSAIALKNLKHD